jgi:hypothetical protein
MPLFLTDDGKALQPTARHIWEQLLTEHPKIHSLLDDEKSRQSFSLSHQLAEGCGKSIYDALLQELRDRIEQEREKAEYAFAARRRAIERIGLPEVRDHRANLLAQEKVTFQQHLAQKAQAYPEMIPLLMLRVEGGGHG